MPTRRHFLTLVPMTAFAVGFGRTACAAPAPLAETDPAALALGYKIDATKVDAKKFPAYVAGRECGGCQLYEGNASDEMGPCSAFPGKAVSSKGWCVAWN